MPKQENNALQKKNFTKQFRKSAFYVEWAQWRSQPKNLGGQNIMGGAKCLILGE